jgi:hypothetical protein
MACLANPLRRVELIDGYDPRSSRVPYHQNGALVAHGAVLSTGSVHLRIVTVARVRETAAINSRGRIRTCDLRVMSPASYRTALPCVVDTVRCNGSTPTPHLADASRLHAPVDRVKTLPMQSREQGDHGLRGTRDSVPVRHRERRRCARDHAGSKSESRDQSLQRSNLTLE